MPPDMREVLVEKLAEMLVAEVQANQAVLERTVKEPSLNNRRREAEGPRGTE
jgi:hypothetical protein